MNQDEDLKQVLRAWSAPAPPPLLDERVMRSYTRSRLWRRRAGPLVLVAAVAGLFLVAVMLRPARAVREMGTAVIPRPSGTEVVSRGDLSEFVPVTEPVFRVVRKETR